MRAMSDTLAGARQLSFATTEVLEVVEPNGDKRPLRFSRKVTLRRPDGLLFELHGSEGTKLEVTAYYDGRTVSLRDDVLDVWAQAEVPASVDEMLDDVARRFSLPVPVADVLYDSPYDALIGGIAQGGFVARSSVDGVECVELVYADDLVEVRVWILDTGQALPRRLEILYKQAPSMPTSQMNFTSWNLDAAVADETFTIEPPPEFSRVAVEELVAGLTSGAAE